MIPSDEMVLNLINEGLHQQHCGGVCKESWETCDEEFPRVQEAPGLLMALMTQQQAQGAATERTRLREDFTHVVDFAEQGFGLLHPIRCRPNLLDCPVNQAINSLTECPVLVYGRYFVSLDEHGEIEVGEETEPDYDPIEQLLMEGMAESG